jgi:hypothetical protein
MVFVRGGVSGVVARSIIRCPMHTASRCVMFDVSCCAIEAIVLKTACPLEAACCIVYCMVGLTFLEVGVECWANATTVYTCADIRCRGWDGA